MSSLNQTSHANPAHSGTNMTLTLEPRDQSSGREMTANQGHRAVRSDQVVAQPHNMLLAVPVGSVSSKQLSTSTSSLAGKCSGLNQQSQRPLGTKGQISRGEQLQATFSLLYLNIIPMKAAESPFMILFFY